MDEQDKIDKNENQSIKIQELLNHNKNKVQSL